MSSSWSGLRVLVAGAGGFLGSHVYDRVAALGATTYGLVRQGQSDGHVLLADLTDPAAVRRALDESRPDVVFQLAGQTSAAPDRELVLSSFRNNLTSTVVLMSQLADVGCRRLIITASLEEPESRGTETAPLSPYGVSKWAEAGYARMFHKLYGFPVTIARVFMGYGPRQRPTKLIPYVVRSLLQGESPTIGQPDRTVDWIYIDDVVDALLAVALKPHLDGETVDIGSGELVSIRDVADVIQEIVGGPAAVRAQAAEAPVGVGGRRADVERTRRLLGWQPATPLRAGLEKTVAWYRSGL